MNSPALTKARNKYRRLNKAAGRCITCGAKRNKSANYCDYHFEMAMNNQRRRRGNKPRKKCQSSNAI